MSAMTWTAVFLITMGVLATGTVVLLNSASHSHATAPSSSSSGGWNWGFNWGWQPNGDQPPGAGLPQESQPTFLPPYSPPPPYSFPPEPTFPSYPAVPRFPDHSFPPFPTPYFYTPQPGVSPCAKGDLAVSIASDAATYSAGTPVQLTVTLRNHSARTCSVPDNPCTDSAALVQSSSLGQVWDSRRDASSGNDCTSFAAGWAASTNVKPAGTAHFTYTWRQGVCSPSASCTQAQVPPGTYSAGGLWPTSSSGEVDSSAIRIQIAA